MVGDTHLDIKAAFNAGISCVALSCGYESVDSLKSYGVNVRANAYEAVEYIKNLGSRHFNLIQYHFKA